MTKETSNKFNEAHGKDMIIYEWIAPPGTSPYDIPAKLEAAMPGLKLSMGNVRNGYINTSLRPDGSLDVAVALHMHPCLDKNCKAGEGAVEIHPAPALNESQESALVLSVGEQKG